MTRESGSPLAFSASDTRRDDFWASIQSMTNKDNEEEEEKQEDEEEKEEKKEEKVTSANVTTPTPTPMDEIVDITTIEPIQVSQSTA